MFLIYTFLFLQIIFCNFVHNDSLLENSELNIDDVKNLIGKIKSNYLTEKSKINDNYKFKINELKVDRKKELKQLKKDYKKQIRKIRKKYPQIPEIFLESEVIPKKKQPEQKYSN